MKLLLAIAACLGAVSAAPYDDPSLGPTAIGQTAADAVKLFGGAEVAIVPAGLINNPIQSNDESTILTDPGQSLAVLSISGKQIREALERSLLLYPQPNLGFLQVSGLEVGFNRAAVPNSRVTSVQIAGSKLEDGKHYEVAMPVSLQSGQWGYSNLWDKAKIVRSYSATLRDVLKGKHPGASSPRWLPQG